MTRINSRQNAFPKRPFKCLGELERVYRMGGKRTKGFVLTQISHIRMILMFLMILPILRLPLRFGLSGAFELFAIRGLCRLTFVLLMVWGK